MLLGCILTHPKIKIKIKNPQSSRGNAALCSCNHVFFLFFLFFLAPVVTTWAPASLSGRVRFGLPRRRVSYDKSMLSRSSPNLSPTELSPELGGLDSSVMFGDVADNALAGDGPRILARQVWMDGRSPPSTWTSPTSLPFPMTVPWYFESSPVLLCFFFRTAQTLASRLPRASRKCSRRGKTNHSGSLRARAPRRRQLLRE